uniref:Bromo domain-containing protein n=1 Tax=Ananas comosus var. bracteatus TaxID=296719 RepID=A0A6V7PQF6_ANACO|nr:unnamed protein product [Ananas comosus var. bracteatus]
MLSIETATKVVENGIASVHNKRGGANKTKQANQESNYYAQEVATSENGNSSSNSSTDRIIEYVLDVLELKDTNELFTMPDDIQISDYSERVNKPGDFATLRQKHKDGMYKSLEQFELGTKSTSLAGKGQQEMTGMSELHSDIKQGNVEADEGRSRRRKSANDKSKQMRKIQPTTNPIDRTRKHSSESSKPTMEQRRCTYKPGSDPMSSIFSASHKPHGRLVYNNNAPSYQESLRRFVRNAGKEAKMAAEQRCREYVERVKAHLIPAYLRESITNYSTSFPSLIGANSYRSSGLDVASGSATPNFLTNFDRYFGNFSSLGSTTAETNSTSFRGKDISPNGTDNAIVPNTIEPLNKKLETDELLRLFCLIGTPEFFKRSKSIFDSSSSTENKPEQSFKALLGVNDGCSSKNPEKPSNLEQLKQTATSNSPTWNSRLKDSRTGKRKGTSEPEPDPSPFRKGMLPSHLGFGQYARSIQPFQIRSQNPFAAPHST